jgi:hypothetical protein
VVSNKKRSNSVFQRLSFPPRSFESEVPRVSPAPTSWPNSIPIKRGENVSKPKSYTQAVDNGFRHNKEFNSPNQYSLKTREIWVQKKEKIAKLPGLLPFMKFPTFMALDSSAWPNNSFRNWFSAQRPKITPRFASSFKELFSLAAPVIPLCSSASPPSAQIVNPSKSSPLPAAAEQSVGEMANIPIDPAPFVPPGFQVQHIEGRVGVRWVVLPRRQRRHEEYAIATIHPMPEGEVHFQTSEMCLRTFC